MTHSDGKELGKPILKHGRFQHKPLNLEAREIRLLKVQHKQHADSQPVTCTIQRFSPVTRPDYLALSYTWGDPLPVFDILIDGSSFTIRENLHQFFQTYQDDPGFCSKWFWIDQICIDQSNILERNHQVAQMADIYRSAQSVIIWLGPAFPRSNDVLEYLFTTDDPLILPDVERIQRDAESWQRFFELPYWRRLWVCQEILLASQVFVCLGPEVCRWVFRGLSDNRIDLLRLQGGGAFDKRSPADHGRRRFKVLDLQAQSFSFRRKGFSWGEALRVNDRCLCQELRDMVYGLLGIVHHEVRIQPDYEMPVRDIFQAVVKLELQSSVSDEDEGERLRRIDLFMRQLWEMLGLHKSDAAGEDFSHLRNEHLSKYDTESGDIAHSG
jgi:hypothetical protein